MITGKRADRIIIDDPGYDPAASRLWLRNAVQKVIVKRAVADWWRDHNQPKPHGITVSVAGQPLVEGCDFTISGSTGNAWDGSYKVDTNSNGVSTIENNELTASDEDIGSSALSVTDTTTGASPT